MNNKLLIVDDEKQYTDRFAGYVRNTGIEVLVANSPADAYFLAKCHMPSTGTIDFNIGVITGNEVAEVLKSISPDIRLAGITNGDPNNFASSLFNIRETKSIDEKTYRTIVDCLRFSANPGKEYDSYKSKSVGQNENVIALYILVQGYNVARNLQKGIQPVEGMTLPVPPEENIATVLDLTKIGINPAEMHEKVCIADPSLQDDEIAKKFFGAIEGKEFGNIPLEISKHVEKKLKSILEGGL